MHVCEFSKGNVCDVGNKYTLEAIVGQVKKKKAKFNSSYLIKD